MAVTRIKNSGIKTGALKYDSMLAGNAPFDPAATWLIARQTLSSSTATVTFSNIPQTYQHLQIRGIGKSASAGEYFAFIRINGDSGTNYASHELVGNGSAASANGTASNNNAGGMRVAQSTEANVFGALIADFHDYTSTTKNKTIRTFTGADGNVSNTNYRVMLASGLWINTNAITSISITQSGNFASGTTFALYGFKGA